MTSSIMRSLGNSQNEIFNLSNFVFNILERGRPDRGDREIKENLTQRRRV